MEVLSEICKYPPTIKIPFYLAGGDHSQLSLFLYMFYVHIFICV